MSVALKALGEGRFDGSPNVLERLDVASSGGDAVVHLQKISDALSVLQLEESPTYESMPMTPAEVWLDFRNLIGLSSALEEIESDDVVDAVYSQIEAEHPFCVDILPGVTAEAQKAVIRFPTNDYLIRNLKPEIPWASTRNMHRVIDVVADHFRCHHT